MVSGLGPGVGLDRLLSGSGGMQANRMLDALGLPDSMGDMIGAQIDAARGDWAGYARNMMDLTGGMNTGTLDKLFGKGLPGPHFAGRPHSMLGKGRKLWGQQFHTPFGTHDISRQKLGGRGLFGRIAGRSMERNILTNPAFKARMERILGGRIIPDGRADGKITVHRFRPNFGQVPFSNQIANNPMLSGIYGGLARMQGNIEKMMKGLLNDPMGANQSGAAGGAAKSGGSGSVGGSQQAGMPKDADMNKMAGEMGMSPPMSFEDLLFLLMLKYAKKKEKEIMEQAKKLTKAGKGEGGDKAGGARRGFGGGLLGGIGKIAGTAIGGPIGGMVGGMVGNAVGGAVGGGGGGAAGGAAGGGAAGGGAAGGAKGGYDPLDPNQSDTTKQAMLQKMMQDLQKVYQLLTNMMKSMHDMGMASVRNIR